MIRKIIEIDEEKCTGCGQCVTGCAEGALAIIDGKAKIVRDMFCDGLGACIGHCPEDALKIIEREAENFDEDAAMAHVRATSGATPHGCPSAQVVQMNCATANTPVSQSSPVGSSLSHWPVQIRLVPPHAPFLRGAELLIVGDCCPVAIPDFHSRHLQGRVVMLGCPKFDNADEYVAKLTQIFSQADIKSIRVLEMEVPCCSGLSRIVAQALANAGRDIPCVKVIIARTGQTQEELTVQPMAGLTRL